MPFLSLLCFTVFACSTDQSGAPKSAPAIAWKPIKTPIGISLSCPVDLGKPEVTTDTDPKSTTDSYSPKAWPDCEIFVEREDFPSDEDANDPLAQRISDAIIGELDLDGDKVTRIGYGVQGGWPTMDIEGKLTDGKSFWYRITRSKTQHFLVGFSATTLPDRAVVQRVLDTSKLPAEISGGKITKWWPDPAIGDLKDSHVQVWSPIPLKATDDDPEFSIDGGKSLEFQAAFGYTELRVTSVEFDGSIADRFDDGALDQLIKESVPDDDSGTVKFKEFQTIQVGDLKFRSGTYVDDKSVDCRVDLLVHDNRLYRFYASGPRGMLDSEDIKKFFASIVLK